MKTLSTEDQGIQAGTPLSQYKHKIGVYESIPNDKRCELIRKVLHVLDTVIPIADFVSIRLCGSSCS